jgi:hypothetical protein
MGSLEKDRKAEGGSGNTEGNLGTEGAEGNLGTEEEGNMGTWNVVGSDMGEGEGVGGTEGTEGTEGAEGIEGNMGTETETEGTEDLGTWAAVGKCTPS